MGSILLHEYMTMELSIRPQMDARAAPSLELFDGAVTIL